MSLLHSVRMRVISLAAAAVVGAVFLLPVSQGVAEHHEGSVAKFDSEGNLLRPTGYREWVFIGTPMPGKELSLYGVRKSASSWAPRGGGRAPLPARASWVTHPDRDLLIEGRSRSGERANPGRIRARDPNGNGSGLDPVSCG